MRKAARLAFTTTLAAACSSAPAERPLTPASAPETGSARAAPASEYRWAAPSLFQKTMTVTLEQGQGIVFEGGRAVVAPDGQEIVRVLDEAPMRRVDRLPAFLGGGFLFATAAALYTSASFDGPLSAWAGIGTPRDVSFGPTTVLVRASDGQRFAIDPTTGKQVDLSPPSVIDVLGDANGRAAALGAGNALWISADRGKTWSEATARLRAAPAGLVLVDGAVWVTDSARAAYRVDAGPELALFDALPTTKPVRPADTAWRMKELPITAAVRSGARSPDNASQAIVVARGDVFSVDLKSGEAKPLARGKLPSDMPCEIVRAPDDLLAVCAVRGRPSLVASGLRDGKVHVEKTFANEGSFYASDDGALVYGGSCDGTKRPFAACSRAEPGAWTDVALPDPTATPSPSATPPPPTPPGQKAQKSPRLTDLRRWLPRWRDSPLALLGGEVPGVHDLASGTTTAWMAGDTDAHETEQLRRVRDALETTPRVIVDRRWSTAPDGSLGGWIDHGESLRITSGVVARSAFRYDSAVCREAYALASDHDGRYFQSTDRGATWNEVAAPPQRGRLSILNCTEIGCDIGQIVRLGWPSSEPRPETPPPTPLPPTPALARYPLPALTCVPAGPERATTTTQPTSPSTSAGFGMRRLPPEEVQQSFSRGPVNPPYDRTNVQDPMNRGLVHGFPASFDPDVQGGPFAGITVQGPNKDPSSFRRTLDYCEPFDTTAAVKSVELGLSAFVDFARLNGQRVGEMVSLNAPLIDALVPILPRERGSPSGVAVTIGLSSGALLGSALGAGGLKVLGLHQVDGALTSAVETGPGEMAVLLVGSDGGDTVLRFAGTGPTTALELPAPPQNLAPSNADALALGPRGELAILRTASGPRPPDSTDPAVLLPLGTPGPAVTLAPWSTLLPASDPACASDGGYRAIVQVAGTWLSVGGTRNGPMSAAVNWSAKRVCLEAVEIDAGTRRYPTSTDGVTTTVVARFAGKAPVGVRVAIGPFVEIRQPMSCRIDR